MKKIISQAFSLVELMVTLIVISCIISALVPVITKKLKSQAITVGSGGGGNNNLEFEQDCSAFGVDCALCFEDKCAMCAKDCLDSEYVNTPKCTCKPCSDFSPQCLECSSRQCRKCSAGYYPSGTNCLICPVGSYCDGTNKTTCPEGQYTDLEGQTSCKNCEIGYACTNGQKSACLAGTYSSANSSSCLTCPKGYYCPGISDKTQCTGVDYQPLEGQPSCQTCSDAGYYVSDDRTSCSACEAGYRCSGDGSRIQCSAGTYSTTGASTCTSCSSGTYSTTVGATSSSTCKTCASKTANCTACNVTTGVCSACENRYKLKNSTCTAMAACEEVNCGSLAMCIALTSTKGACMTKYNIGDNSSFPIPSSVTTATLPSGSCSSSSSKMCCWKGTTSDGCDSTNGGYTGCKRTVCDWKAANAACANLTYNNMTWRMPTNSEWQVIGGALSTYTIGKGTSGLMLCDDKSGYSSARCNDTNLCPGSTNNECCPHCYWSLNGTSAYNYYLKYGAWNTLKRNGSYYGFSVRCIADL